MSEANPYASPQTTFDDPRWVETGDGVWRDGSALVMRKDGVLPDRCIKCNAPANGQRLRRNLSWHHPGWFLLIFVSLLIYAIVALCIRKRAKIDVGICDLHRSRRRTGIITAWLIFAMGVIAITVGSSQNQLSYLIAVGAAMILASLIIGVIVSNIVTTKRIDDNFVWLKNVNEEYLTQFPSVSAM